MVPHVSTEVQTCWQDHRLLDLSGRGCYQMCFERNRCFTFWEKPRGKEQKLLYVLFAIKRPCSFHFIVFSLICVLQVFSLRSTATWIVVFLKETRWCLSTGLENMMCFLSHAAIWPGFHPRLMVALKISVVNGDLPYPEPIFHHPCHPCHPCLASDVVSPAAFCIICTFPTSPNCHLNCGIMKWIWSNMWAYDSIICELWMRISTFSKPICKRLQSKDQWGCDDFLEGHLDLNLFSRDIFHAGDWRLSFCILSIPSGRRVVLWTKMWKGVALSANGWAKRLGRDGIELAFHIYSYRYHYPLFSFHPDCPSSNMFHSSSFI